MKSGKISMHSQRIYFWYLDWYEEELKIPEDYFEPG